MTNLQEVANQISTLLEPLGPNMRKLAAEAATARTIKQAGNAFAGMLRIAGGEHILEDMAFGANFARLAVKALRDARDSQEEVNPYRGKSDEEIAGLVLERLALRDVQRKVEANKEFGQFGKLSAQTTSTVDPFGPGRMAPSRVDDPFFPARPYFR